MKIKSKSLAIFAAVAAMLATSIPASAAEVAYPGMTASFATEGAAQATAAIPLDPNHTFTAELGQVRYYSGTIALNYLHSNVWSVDGASFVNFLWNANAADSDLVAATIGIGNNDQTPRFAFPDYGFTTGTAMPATIDYQIKLTGTGAGYTIAIFTGPASKAATEGTPVATGSGNFTYYGDFITAVSFSTSGNGDAGTAASSNFKSSDAWIPGAVVAGVVSDPYFTPVGGTYSTDQSVSIATNTAGATIHYTQDGSPPTTSSPVYSVPLTVSSTQTIKALAVKSGDTDSAVTEETYTMQPATPVPDVAGGTYNTKDQTVTLSSATAGAVIYYTLNGDTPDDTSTLYTGPITVSNDVTISAIAYYAAYDPSDVWVGSYVFRTGTPVLAPPGGTYASAPAVTLTSVTPGASIYYTTDGNTPDNTSTLYTGPITVSAAQTLSAIAYAPGYADSLVAVGNYVLDPTLLAAWNFGANPETSAPYTLAAGLDSGITLARGTNFGSGYTYSGSHFDTQSAPAPVDLAEAITAETYATFTLTPLAGKKVSISEVNFRVGANAQPTSNAVGEMVFSQDGFATYTSVGVVAVANFVNGTLGTFDVSAVAALQNQESPIEFRCYFYGNGAFEIRGLGSNPASGSDILLRGVVANTGGVDDFASWAASQMPPVTGGANGDSDNDGIKNLVEYALADGTSGTYTGGTLTFTKRGAPYGSDIVYAIEESTDLLFWTPAASTQNASTISFAFSGPVPAKKFARLKVTQP